VKETKLSQYGEPKFQVRFKEVFIFNILYVLNMIILNRVNLKENKNKK